MNYSTDIWDYISDMSYMPSRTDRDRLVQEAKENPEKNKRVRLWDYFFRINPNDVGKPQKKEISELEKYLFNAQNTYENESRKVQGEINNLKAALTGIKREIDQHASQIEREIREKVMRARSRNKGLGIAGMGIAGGIFLIGLIFAAAASSSAFFVCGGVFALGAAVIGAIFLVPLSQDPENKIRLDTDARKAKLLPQLQTRESDFTARLNGLTTQFDYNAKNFSNLSGGKKARKDQLLREIDNLIRQIPQPPTDKEVDDWFYQDVAQLRKVAVERTNLQERLIENISGTENPISINTPAELQEGDRIPPPFKQDGTDNYKHLWARRFVIKPNGRFMDYHGIYSLEYILIAEEIFAVYSTNWSFIRGEQLGERRRKIYYKKITLTEQEKGHREIQTENGKVGIYNSPMFTINLEDGSRYSVAFPDADYMKKANAPRFDEDSWDNDQTDAVENAMKVINERIRIAQGS